MLKKKGCIMVNYDKTAIRESLTIEQYYELLEDFGAEPEYTSFGLICSTICHNMPGEGSRKLYYYRNSDLFHCFTGCEEPSFDLFQLVIKVQEIQYHQVYDLNMAVRWVAQRFGIAGAVFEEDNLTASEDWTILKNYDKIQEIDTATHIITLKEYDPIILKRFNYDVEITPWINENINKEVMSYAGIGYYPGEEKITIPHYDKDNRLVGLRGRALVANEAEMYGKYLPLKICGTLYSHPLGMNLYGLNWAQENIRSFKKAIVVESEKSVLQYMSFMGIENNIAVACCGSSLSTHQFQMLVNAGAQEIIIGFDKDFEESYDSVFQKQVKNLTNIYKKFGSYVQISFMFDKYNNILPQKCSPTELGKEVFMKMFKERIIL